MLYIFDWQISPAVIFQLSTFQHDLLPVRLHSSQGENLRLEKHRVFVCVEVDVRIGVFPPFHLY